MAAHPLAPVRGSDRLVVATSQPCATKPRRPPPCRSRPRASAAPLSVVRPYALASNESSDTFVLPFASQINHAPSTPTHNRPFEAEVIFCVQGAISPLLSNLYLNEVDKMLERAREVTRNGKYTYIEYARFADDLVILIDAYKRHDWLVGAVDKRLREEFGKLQVEINDEKSRTVDLERGECFGFLGFEFRSLRGLSGAMRPHYTPKLKKRTALVRALKEVFRRHRSQPIARVIGLINPVLRGWVNYFAAGHSSECLSFIKDWVEKKVRRHLAHAQKRKGFSWERWNRQWLYDTLGLFNAYRVRRDGPKVAPAG